MILLDILDDLDDINLTKSPIEGFEEKKALFEKDIYEDNIKLIKGVLEYFKEGIECYLMLSKQNKKKRILPDANCYIVIQLIERGRFTIGMVLEGLKNIRAKIQFIVVRV